MSPEKLARLKVTLAAAEALNKGQADREAVETFIAREGGRERFSAGAHAVSLLGITGTSTMSVTAALASWIRKANRKLERENG